MPLEKWNLQINYGIKTGFNDAFYLTQAQRDTYVAEDPRCADHLVPLLRGRYIDRYASNWDGTWMIATFPALDIKFTELPAPIRKHLEAHRPSLEPKPRSWKGAKWDGRKAGDYEWFETQDVISYHSDFAKPKIMYPNMTKFLPFYFDDRNGYYTNDKGFIINFPRSSRYPTSLAFLNSHLFRCCFRDNFPGTDGQHL